MDLDDELGPPPPLPPAWTVGRYDTFEWDDDAAVSQLPDTDSDDDGQMIFDYHLWRERRRRSDEAQSEDVPQTNSRDPEEHRIAVKYGIEDCWNGIIYGDFMSLAAMMEADPAMTCFGFAIFKTWGYGSVSEQQRWNAFWHDWLEYFDEHLRALGATGDLRLHGIASRLKWHVVDDPALQGASIDTCSERLFAMGEALELELGTELDMALMPSESLALEISKASSHHQKGMLHITALDARGRSPASAELEDDQRRRLAAQGVDTSNLQANFYPGHFPMRVASVFPLAYEALEELEPFAMYPGRDRTGRPKVWTGLPITIEDDAPAVRFKTRQTSSGQLVEVE